MDYTRRQENKWELIVEKHKKREDQITQVARKESQNQLHN